MPETTGKAADFQSTIVNNSNTKKEEGVPELQKKVAGYERVMKEMKK